MRRARMVGLLTSACGPAGGMASEGRGMGTSRCALLGMGLATMLTVLLVGTGALAEPAEGERYEDGAWYYYNADGTRATGWRYLESSGGKWVYYDESGAMVHGEACLYPGNDEASRALGRHWYYFDDATGATTYGWRYVASSGGKWVYYDGTPQTGGMGWMLHGEAYVRQDNNEGSPSHWYYFDDATGATTYGWRQLSSSGGKRVYYLPVVGYMAHGWLTEGNVTMHLDEVTGALRHIEENPPKLVDQQAEGAPMGCEAAALYMALQEKGHALDLTYRQFLATMPYASDGNPNHGFSASPYNGEGEYSSIYPAPLASWGSRYGSVQDISGSSVQQVIDQLWVGNPVVVYVTVGYATPRWVQCSFGWAVDNAHIMTATGYDADSDTLQMHDPSHGRRYWVSRDTFAQAFDAQHFAVVVSG